MVLGAGAGIGAILNIGIRTLRTMSGKSERQNPTTVRRLGHLLIPLTLEDSTQYQREKADRVFAYMLSRGNLGAPMSKGPHQNRLRTAARFCSELADWCDVTFWQSAQPLERVSIRFQYDLWVLRRIKRSLSLGVLA